MSKDYRVIFKKMAGPPPYPGNTYQAPIEMPPPTYAPVLYDQYGNPVQLVYSQGPMTNNWNPVPIPPSSNTQQYQHQPLPQQQYYPPPTGNKEQTRGCLAGYFVYN